MSQKREIFNLNSQTQHKHIFLKIHTFFINKKKKVHLKTAEFSHETTRFAFGRVGWTQQAPLRWLKSARTTVVENM